MAILNNKDIEIIKEKIANKFNPKKIYLFGSYAYGNPNEDSDLDILVIDDRSKNIKQEAFEISKSLYPRNYGLDVICCDEESFNVRLKNKWMLYREIANRGKLLYERRGNSIF